MKFRKKILNSAYKYKGQQEGKEAIQIKSLTQELGDLLIVSKIQQSSTIKTICKRVSVFSRGRGEEVVFKR